MTKTSNEKLERLIELCEIRGNPDDIWLEEQSNELQTLRLEILQELQITERVKQYYESISEESIRTSHLWHPTFTNTQMHSLILSLKTLFEMLLMKVEPNQ